MLAVGKGGGGNAIFNFLVLVVGEAVTQFKLFDRRVGVFPATMQLHPVLPHIAIRTGFLSMLIIMVIIMIMVMFVAMVAVPWDTILLF